MTNDRLMELLFGQSQGSSSSQSLFEPNSVNSLVGSIVNTQLDASPVIPTLPYQCHGDTESLAPIVIPRVLVKVACRESKTEKNFVLSDIEEADIATIKDLKFYFQSKLPVKQIVSVGYMLNGRKKVWMKTDDELAELIKTSLRKGKGSLWCEGISTDINDVHDPESPKPKPDSKRRKTVIDEKRERVQELFEELKVKHGASFSAPQYRLWAEAIASGGHSSMEEPPKGSLFKRKSPGNRHIECSAAATATATIMCSPAKDVVASAKASSSSSLTPRSAAALKSTYIKQIKELHELLELHAISEEDFSKQRDHILDMMGSL